MYLNSRFFYVIPIAIIALTVYIFKTASALQMLSIYLVYFFLYSNCISFGSHTINCHKEVTIHPFLNNFYKLISVFCFLGSPAWQRSGHLSHHKWAETSKDCQPANIKQIRGYSDLSRIDKKILVRSLAQQTAFDIFLNKYYFLLIFGFHLTCLMLLKMSYYFYFVLFPSLLTLFSIYLVRIFGHIHFANYKNNDCPGYNIPWLFFLVFDDAWHNNHHSEAEGNETKTQWFEIRINDLWKKILT